MEWKSGWTFDRLAAQLVAECEAFLNGRYPECLEASGRPVPTWGWLNVLAHGSTADLRDVVTGRRWGCPGRGCPRGWRRALSYAASEILDAAGDEAGLRALQRSRLKPIELLLSTDYAFVGLGPAELVGLVLIALDRKPSRRRGPESDEGR